MMPCCTNCLHWDEESAEDNVEGLGLCLHPDLEQDYPDSLPAHLSNGNKAVILLRSRGDYSCPLFQGKTVTPAPTHPSSEAD